MKPRATFVLFAAVVVSWMPAVYYGFRLWSVRDVEPSGQKEPDPAFHFVLIAQDVNNPYWRVVYRGAADAAAAHGGAVEFLGPVEANMERHIRLIERSVSAGVDGILTQGLDETTFRPVIDKAIERGVPVVTIDTDAPTSKRLAYVGSDNYLAGAQAGRFMAQATGGVARIGVVTGSFEATNMKQRLKGFEDAIRPFPGMRIVSVESSNISRVRAIEKTALLLNRHPEINALFGASALDGTAMAQVVSGRGRRDVFILAFDDLPETIEWMRKGVIAATVVQEPYRMGYDGVELLLRAARNERLESNYYTATRILTAKEVSSKGPASDGADSGGTEATNADATKIGATGAIATDAGAADADG